MTSQWPTVPLEAVLQEVRRPVQVDTARTYREIGIRSHGRGVFHKGPVEGAALGRKRVFWIEPGDFVLNIVFAWEGAVGVVGEPERGMIGSHRFPCFRPRDERLDVRYLLHYLQTPQGLRLLGRVSPGGAGRNRTLSRERFLAEAIPLPPRSVQARLIERLDGTAQRLSDVRQLQERVLADLEAAVTALHLERSARRQVVFGDVFRLDERAVAIQPFEAYPLAGVRGYGRGLFSKPAILGSATSYRSFNQLYEGALVISQVKGWEGAVAVARNDVVGMFVSPEYRTFRCEEAQADWRYVAHLAATPWFRQLLVRATHGAGGRRERTRPEKLVLLRFEMPQVEEQRRALPLLDRLAEVRTLGDETLAEASALPASMLDAEFR